LCAFEVQGRFVPWFEPQKFEHAGRWLGKVCLTKSALAAEESSTMYSKGATSTLGNSHLAKLTSSNRFKIFAIFLVFAFIFASSAARLSAQTFGEISGHIVDSTGAVIPGTNVMLTNVGTGGVRATVSTESGDYTFTAVPVGEYRIQASHASFKTATSNTVKLQMQQSMRLDFTLEVGAVSDTIEVSASAALLQSENATIGTVVENKAVNELPLNGRNYLGLVALSSNVNTLSPQSGQAGSRMGGDRASQAIAVGGQRIMFDYYTLDGVNNTDPDFNTYTALPSLDGIAEFKVQTAYTLLSLVTKRHRLVWSARVEPTFITAVCTTSSETTWRMQSRIFFRTRQQPPQSTPTSGITTDSSLTGQSGFPGFTTAKTSSSS
jgi:hypothetical protein